MKLGSDKIHIHYHQRRLPAHYDDRQDSSLGWKCKECRKLTPLGTYHQNIVETIYGCKTCGFTGVQAIPYFDLNLKLLYNINPDIWIDAVKGR